ncbi:PKD domain-containing protein [Candidatus Peregrinibacteria bacterium]|nr:PKD domain-containing protein [Candidatus Peregrinibacteria bacterium]
MKKLISFLLVSLIAAFALSFASISVANAGALDELKKLITSGDQDGTDFTEFKPGEDLTLTADGLNESLTTEDNLKSYVIRVVNFALGFLGLIAIIIVIYGGILYVTAGGEEEKTQTGKKAITYAVIGIIIILGSFAFVNTIIKGASGGKENGRFVSGSAIGNSFNASAVQVRNIAREIYTGFILLSESAEELKGILSDLDKPQFSYKKTLVDRNNMLSFLASAEAKLRNIQARLIKFSTAYTRINELLRYIDLAKSQVQAANDFQLAKINGGNLNVETCEISRPDSTGASTGFGATGGTTGGIGSATSSNTDQKAEYCAGYSEYPVDLVPIWNGISENLLDDETNPLSIKYVFDPLKKDYLRKLLSFFSELQDIRDTLTGLKAAEAGDIGKVYDQMKATFGFTDDDIKKTTDGGFPDNAYNAGFIGALYNWELYNTATGDDKGAVTEQMGVMLLSALEKQFEFADLLTKLKSVEAHLRANVINGNAPLVVTFDIIDSLDPAGGTIVPSNIKWNLSGAQTFEGENLQDESLQKVAITADTVVCDEGTYTDKPDLYGTVFRQCTFKRPGTYVATVTIGSNDPTKFISGQSSLIIKVNPPTNKIDLNVKPQSAQQGVNVISYYTNGLLKNDQDLVPMTLKEAKSVIFDASGTTPKITNFTWDFGDGTKIDTDASGKQTHEYKVEGKYRVQLEVINELGELDRKIFTVEVRNIAARIQVSPTENILIDQAVLIDGRLSSASSGKIKLYEWKLTKISGQGAPKDVDLTLNKNKSSFSHKFAEPGKYQIDLTITSDLETVSAQPYFVTVASKPPVAIFDHKTPEPHQPGTVHFNGSKSFDPDGEEENLLFNWTIEPDSNNGKNWLYIVDNRSSLQKAPKVKFLKSQEYEVTLKVTDKNTLAADLKEESGEITKKIEIKNVLDIAWDENQNVTAVLDKDGKATINFKFESTNGKAYEINFGDGEKSSGDIKISAVVPHTYTEGGKFTAEVRVYDADDNDNSVKRTIFIGGSNSPIAKAEILVNGVQIPDTSEIIDVYKKDVLTFDASASKNIDGSGRNLKYSWDFGDTELSSNKTATHSYKELSPKDPGYFTASLKVFDKDEPNKISEDKLKIRVNASAPTFSSLQAVPETRDGKLITPVTVNLKAFNPEDKDGQITQYKWWYFDVDDPDEQLGVQVTQVPSARLIIGTSGKEGLEREYGFGLEVTDSDNLKTSSEDIFDKNNVPKVKVKNGPNDLPIAKFSVNTTKVFTGDEVTFTSSSKDPDGKITAYIWDLEGDGFFNNMPIDKSVVEYVYKEQKKDGYEVRLKVRDDKGGEAVSEPVKIYVQTLAKAPTAAFKFQVIEGSGGKKVKFTNNSTADKDAGAEIIAFKWDFDTASQFDNADSDGDGKKDNDSDSTAKEPERLYIDAGEYVVKLTVTDNQGSTDETTQKLVIPLANAPTAAFTYKIVAGKIIFTDNSTADTAKGAKIEKYTWDFDTDSQLDNADSDGDGKKDNDKDSTEKEPTFTYPIEGEYKVKLMVTDNYGNTDDVVNKVNTKTGPNLSDPGNFGDNPDDPIDGFGLKDPNKKSPSQSLVAVMSSNPKPDKDGILYLTGDKGTVTFDFTGSIGQIADYTFDKNIYFDTDKNGINHDDQDFKTPLPGTWTTNFEKAWGKIVVKLTIKDIYGNENSVSQEIKFK